MCELTGKYLAAGFVLSLIKTNIALRDAYLAAIGIEKELVPPILITCPLKLYDLYCGITNCRN